MGSRTRIKTRIAYFLGTDKLNKEFIIFSFVYLGFAIFTNLTSVFINTLFYRLTNDSNIVMQYNIIFYITAATAMCISTCVMRKTSPILVCRLGLTFYIILYLVFFLSMNNLSFMMPVIAILAGSGTAFFFLSYFINVTAYSTDENRDSALALIGIFGGIVSIIMPSVSGFVIGAFANDGSGEANLTGYVIMFGISLLAAIITILLTFKLPALKPEDKSVRIFKAIKATFSNKALQIGLLGELFKGFREGPFGFFLNILLFEIIKNERIVGINTFFCGIAALFSFWLSGKIVTNKNRLKFIFLSVSTLILFTSALFLNLSPATIIILSIVHSFSNVYISNPSLSIFLLIAQMFGKENRYEMYAMREVYLTIGRVLGVILIIVIPRYMASSNTAYIIAMIILVSSQYIMLLLNKQGLKEIDKLKKLSGDSNE